MKFRLKIIVGHHQSQYQVISIIRQEQIHYNGTRNSYKFLRALKDIFQTSDFKC